MKAIRQLTSKMILKGKVQEERRGKMKKRNVRQSNHSMTNSVYCRTGNFTNSQRQIKNGPYFAKAAEKFLNEKDNTLKKQKQQNHQLSFNGNFSEMDIQNLHTWQSSLIIQRNFLTQQLNMPFANEQLIQSQLMNVIQSLEYVNQRITQHFISCSNQQPLYSGPHPINASNRSPDYLMSSMPSDTDGETSIASDILNYHSWFERPEDKCKDSASDNKSNKTTVTEKSNEYKTNQDSKFKKHFRNSPSFQTAPRKSRSTSLFQTSNNKSANIWKYDNDQL